MPNLAEIKAIRDLCAKAQTSSRRLDGLFFKAMHYSTDRDWSDAFGDDVWHRRSLEDSGAFDGPPPYTEHLEYGLEEKPKGYRLELVELSPDLWEAALLRDGTGSRARAIGSTAPLAYLAALCELILIRS